MFIEPYYSQYLKSDRTWTYLGLMILVTCVMFIFREPLTAWGIFIPTIILWIIFCAWAAIRLSVIEFRAFLKYFEQRDTLFKKLGIEVKDSSAR
jgi:predicted Na+-dependent transporter